mgnify:CR=1 FL=1
MLLLFCVIFISIYNDVTQEIGFKFLTGIQALYFIIFMFQLMNDNARSIKAIRIDIPKSKFSVESHFNIPLYFILLPGLILQLISSTYITITSNFLYKKYDTMQLSRNNRWNLDMFKWMFIVTTFMLIILTYSYCNDFDSGNLFTKFSGSYKSFLLICVVSTIVFSITNYINSEKLSKIVVKSTD